MGICSSKNPKDLIFLEKELKSNVLFSSLKTTKDVEDLFSIFKRENLGDIFHINLLGHHDLNLARKNIIIVLSGELQVCIENPDISTDQSSESHNLLKSSYNRLSHGHHAEASSSVARIVRSGEMIHFFSSPIEVPDVDQKSSINAQKGIPLGHSIVLKNSQLRQGLILSCETSDINRFLSQTDQSSISQSKLNDLKLCRSLLSMSLSSTLSKAPLIKGISENDIKLILPLLSFKAMKKGEVVVEYGGDPSLTDDGLMAFVLVGEFVRLTDYSVVESDSQCLDFSNSLHEHHDNHLNGRTQRIQDHNHHPSFFYSSSNALDRTADESPPQPEPVGSVKGKLRNSAIKIISSLGKQRSNSKIYQTLQGFETFGVKLDVGSDIGTELCLIERSAGRSLETVVTNSEEAVIGTLSRRSFMALEKMAPEIARRIRLNYHRHILEVIKAHVPILNELDQTGLKELARSTNIDGAAAGCTIYAEGDNGENFYVLLFGTVQTVQKSSDDDDHGQSQSFGELLHHNLEPFLCFGDSALVTTAPRNSSAKAITDCVFLTIRGSALRSSSNYSRDLLLEMKISSAGLNVDLKLILQHTKGFKCFLDFTEAEHAAENVLFWEAVSNYQDICSKLIHSIQDGYSQSFEKFVEDLDEDSEESGKVITTEPETITTTTTTTTETAASGPIENKECSAEQETESAKLFYALEAALGTVHTAACLIVERFIHPQSELEVNIPGSMRKEIESLLHVLGQELANASARMSQASRAHPDETEALSNSMRMLLKGSKMLFDKALKEVFNLMKKDSFSRWRESSSFSIFLSKIKANFKSNRSMSRTLTKRNLTMRK